MVGRLENAEKKKMDEMRLEELTERLELIKKEGENIEGIALTDSRGGLILGKPTPVNEVYTNDSLSIIYDILERGSDGKLTPRNFVDAIIGLAKLDQAKRWDFPENLYIHVDSKRLDEMLGGANGSDKKEIAMQALSAVTIEYNPSLGYDRTLRLIDSGP